MLKVNIRDRDDVIIIDLEGRITLGSGDKILHDTIDDLLGAGHRTLVLNLAGIEHIDSSGLGELVSALRVTRAMGGRLRVVVPPGRVFETLSVARLLPLFKVFQSEEEVVQSFAQEPEPRDGRHVTVEFRESIAIVGFDRPRHYNALTRTMLSDLVSALAAVRRGRKVGAVVVVGHGRDFSIGADLNELREGEGSQPSLELLQTVIKDLAELGCVTIAAVSGEACGSGLDLALACDLRIASHDACFAASQIRMGLVPVGGSSYTLARVVGLGRANDLLLSGRRIGAEEAERWGLVNRLTSRTQLMTEACAWAGEFADGPRHATEETRNLVQLSGEGALAAALTREVAAAGRVLSGAEFREGLHARLEQREPGFPR